MGWLFAILMSVSTLTWAASPSATIESLSSQVVPLWQAIRPACSMALEPSVQAAVTPRMSFLDDHLIASELINGLVPYSKDKSAQWNSPLWATREKLERAALKIDNRESLREYFFKLQTQKPNPKRSELVSNIQYMSERLNITLRKELWKTCHAIGLGQLPAEQLEKAVEQRWLAQKDKVTVQLQRELASYYFYSFRQTSNDTLQGFSDVAKPLKPWVSSTSEGISSYFQTLRAELNSVPMVITPDVTVEPFLEERPWTALPSQALPQP